MYLEIMKQHTPYLNTGVFTLNAKRRKMNRYFFNNQTDKITFEAFLNFKIFLFI